MKRFDMGIIVILSLITIIEAAIGNRERAARSLAALAGFTIGGMKEDEE